MKLRNKKTGEIKSIEEIIRDAFLSNELDSLKNIDANWEDVDGTNDTNTPLIKDEKIRKVVRAWAECCCIPLLKHYFSNGFSCFICKDEEDNDYCLDFTFRIDNLAPEHIYTITELCGEECIKHDD